MNNSEKMLVSLDQQDLARANKYFKKALVQDDAEVILELANYLETIGFYPQAKEAYLQLREEFPEVLLNLAQIANEDGDTEEAFSYLEEIQQSSPFYLESLVVKADLYQSEGLTDVAREKLLEAENLSDEPIISFGLAELEMELGLFKEAIHHYALLDNRDILEQTGVSTYQRIGIAYASLGKFEAAIEFLEKAVELEYDDQTVYELATILYDQEEYQKANLCYKQLDTINSDFEGYEYAYAQSLHAEHNIKGALAILQKGLAKNEFDNQLLLLASQYAYEAHEEKVAEEYLLKAKEQAEDLNEIILRLTNLYLEQERFEEVVALDQEDLDNVLARWNIAKAYMALEDDGRALEAFESLSEELGQNPEFLADYIAILRIHGRVNEAKEYAHRYLHLVPDDVVMQEFYNQE
ncbi:tetratricopeptide repeat protein [Streptococcus sp. X16XC17]|uniref:tetratricopeptide repeat protein n=1 Tax=unclassified Streptococcus TaxID=2608887 RepID=UPI00066FC45E|nr:MULTISPECIES: tetratricopeptide repeat protein [unclassified Streptococcus]TCD46230.1 tetratricopeptide repeat protein [Streptococcus sp. X16XC17]